MNFKQFMLFIGISLLLHLVLLGIAFSTLFTPLLAGFELPELLPGSKEITVTMMDAPQKKQIIDTDQSIPTSTPVENTPFEGDRDTLASSPAPGQGNPNVPNIKGKDIPGQDLYNQRYSPSATPQPPAPPAKPQEQKPEPQKQVKVSDKPESAQVGQNDVTIRPNGQISAGEKSAASQSQTAPQRMSEPSPAQTFSSSRIASTMSGGAMHSGAPSIAVKETEEGRYKVKLYRAIGTRWYTYVGMDSGLLNLGMVKIKFYVKSNGTIVDLQVTSGEDNSALLAISRRSILEVSGQLEPFSANMKEKMGDGFWDEVNFSIY